MANAGEAAEKEVAVAVSTSSPPASPGAMKTGRTDSRDLDLAFKYIQDAKLQDAGGGGGDGLAVEDVDLKALRRRIDWRILPVMFLCYTMQFLDKVNINYAAVMGINADLKLTGNDFSNASTAFFIAYLVAEVPNGYILQKVPVGKYLGLSVFLWGVATACTAAAHDYRSLVAARVFLGLFEAAIAPCLMLIGSQWYTRAEQAPRFSLWYCGLGVAQIVGGLVSFAFQHIGPGAALSGWRTMFVVLGVVTSAFGLLAAWVLPDSPMAATWLGRAEKVALLEHVAGNRTGVANRHFKLAHVWELLIDPQIYLLTVITVLISISSGVITTYSSTVIKTFGYTSRVSALLNMPGGLVSIISILIVGYGVRFRSHRWAWLVACCVPGILGGGLLSFAPSSNRAALLAGIYLINAITATLIILYQWTMANVAGHTKRVVASALIAGSFSVGNIIGPQTFQAKDAPGYRPAKIIVMATQSAGAFVTVVLFGYYVWANRQKDRKQVVDSDSESLGVEDVWGNLTDRENPKFRYVY